MPHALVTDRMSRLWLTLSRRTVGSWMRNPLIKTRRYLEILKSSVRTGDLPACGLAYLEELHNPDASYSGW
jgi:hypothetical protein